MNLLDKVFHGDYSYRRSVSSPQINFQGTARFKEISQKDPLSPRPLLVIARSEATWRSPTIVAPLQEIATPLSGARNDKAFRLYTEEGSYLLKGNEQTCYQKWFFVREEAQLLIYKSDQGLLHEFAIEGEMEFPLQLTHTHLCRDDTYMLTMTIQSLDSFSMSYVIQGPSKDYTVDTTFIRA